MKAYFSPLFEVISVSENDTIRTSGPLQARSSYFDDNSESGADFNKLIGRENV